MSEIEEGDLLQRLRLATSAAGVGIWEWRLDTNEMIYSEAAKAVLGFPADKPVTYEMVVAATHQDDLGMAGAQSRRARDPAIRDTTPFEYRIIKPDGQVRWVYAKGEAIFRRTNGREECVRYIGTIQDVTARKQVEEALRTSEARLRLAMDAGRMAVWQGRAGEEVVVTPEMLRLFGFPEGATPTLTEVRAGYLPGERRRIAEAANAAVARGERSVEVEFQYRQPSGDVRCFLVRADMSLDAEGNVSSGIGVLVDVTERKRAELREQLLAREVDHRAKNLLTVVQGVVALSKANDDGELRRVILGRLEAIAQAHQLLADSRWEGTDLRKLLLQELAPFQAGAQRVALDGPDLILPPAEAQALAMTIHELTTNAAKHGALSVATGLVSVTWRAGDEIEVVWEERGGPPVTPPARRGFGSTLIERATIGLSGAQTTVDWRPEGVVCRIRLVRPVG